MDVLMCTASIWHMATISVDRYCSMRFPLRYRRTRTPVFVIAKIAFVWIVSIGICSPLAIAGFVNPLNVYRGGQCAPAVPEFVIYGSIFAFFVPLVLMVVSYALTVKTLTRTAIWRRQERQRSSQYGDANAPPGEGSIIRASSLIDRSFKAEKNQSVKCPLTPIQSDGESAVRPQSHTSTTAVDRTSTDHVTEKKSAMKKPQTKEMDGRKEQLLMSGMTATSRDDPADVQDNHCNSVHSAMSRPALSTGSATKRNDNEDADSKVDEQRRQHADVSRHIRYRDDVERQTVATADLTTHNDEKASSPNDHPRGTDLSIQRYMATSGPHQTGGRPSFGTQTRRRKRKATRVLGVIFVVFVVLWTPFFVLNIFSAVCPHCVQSVAPSVWTVLVWLGWVSSLANPIIYTSFSPAFRSAFKRLLTCHCAHRMSSAKSRQQQWTDLLRHDRIRCDSRSTQ